MLLQIAAEQAGANQDYLADCLAGANLRKLNKNLL